MRRSEGDGGVGPHQDFNKDSLSCVANEDGRQAAFARR